MYTIDLLQGSGRPPRTRWWQAALVTLAFVGLGSLGAYGYIEYAEAEGHIAGQQRQKKHLEQRVAKLSEIDSFLKQFTAQKDQLQGEVGELSSVLERQIQWSPILTTVAQKVPETMVISDVLIRRQEKKDTADPKKLAFEYILVIGVITESDHEAIESFVNDLRSMKADQPRMREVRVANQRLREIQKQDYLNFVIECRFE